jgi:pilus assembly protein CpaE
MERRRAQRGQATVEAVATLPFVVLVVLVAWQLAVAGQALWLSGSAARAAARAQALGLDPAAAARGTLPGPLDRGVRVRATDDGAVRVSVAIPAVIGHWRVGSVGARARFEPQDAS